MFQFPRCPSCTYGFSTGCHLITDGGFPHSDTPGSQPAYGSPRHFGVRPVLRRHLTPRHPPCALITLSYGYLFFGCLFAFRSLGWPLPSMRGERLVSPARRRFVFDVYLRVASLVVKEQVKVGSSPKEEIDPSKLNRIGTTAACTSCCLDAPQGLSP